MDYNSNNWQQSTRQLPAWGIQQSEKPNIQSFQQGFLTNRYSLPTSTEGRLYSGGSQKFSEFPSQYDKPSVPNGTNQIESTSYHPGFLTDNDVKMKPNVESQQLKYPTQMAASIPQRKLYTPEATLEDYQRAGIPVAQNQANLFRRDADYDENGRFLGTTQERAHKSIAEANAYNIMQQPNPYLRKQMLDNQTDPTVRQLVEQQGGIPSQETYVGGARELDAQKQKAILDSLSRTSPEYQASYKKIQSENPNWADPQITAELDRIQRQRQSDTLHQNAVARMLNEQQAISNAATGQAEQGRPPAGYMYINQGNQRVLVNDPRYRPINEPGKRIGQEPSYFPDVEYRGGQGENYNNLTQDQRRELWRSGMDPNTPEQMDLWQRWGDDRINEKLLSDPYGWKNVGFKRPEDALNWLDAYNAGKATGVNRVPNPSSPIPGRNIQPTLPATIPRSLNATPEPGTTLGNQPPNFNRGFLTAGVPVDTTIPQTFVPSPSTGPKLEPVNTGQLNSEANIALPTVDNRKISEFLEPQGNDSPYARAASYARQQYRRELAQLPELAQSAVLQRMGTVDTGQVNRMFQNLLEERSGALEGELAKLGLAEAEAGQAGRRTQGEFGLSEAARRRAEAYQANQATLGRNLQREMPGVSAGAQASLLGPQTEAEKQLITARTGSQQVLDVSRNALDLISTIHKATIQGDMDARSKGLEGLYNQGLEVGSRNPKDVDASVSSMDSFRTSNPNEYNTWLGGVRLGQYQNRTADKQRSFLNSQTLADASYKSWREYAIGLQHDGSKFGDSNVQDEYRRLQTQDPYAALGYRSGFGDID